MVASLTVLIALWSAGAGPCEPNSGDCGGACAGQNITANASPAPGGNNVSFGIHICDPSTMTCSSSVGSHPSTSSNRSQLAEDGCTVTIAPKQGLTWGEICSCDDLAVHCDGGR